MMGCCGGETEKKEGVEDKKKSGDESVEEKKDSGAHGAKGGQGGCGMHGGGGFMKWLWIGLLVYLVVSYLR